MIIYQNPIDNCEIYVLLYSSCYIGIQLCNNSRKSVFIDTLALREVCGSNFVFAILQITLRILKFKLSLVTSENTQVSIYKTLSPRICLTRASVT